MAAGIETQPETLSQEAITAMNEFFELYKKQPYSKLGALGAKAIYALIEDQTALLRRLYLQESKGEADASGMSLNNG